MQSHINIGSGQEISIRALGETVKEVVEYKGKIEWDASKPDGTMRKLMDSSRLETFGWKPSVYLREGIQKSYEDFLNSSNLPL